MGRAFGPTQFVGLGEREQRGPRGEVGRARASRPGGRRTAGRPGGLPAKEREREKKKRRTGERHHWEGAGVPAWPGGRRPGDRRPSRQRRSGYGSPMRARWNVPYRKALEEFEPPKLPSNAQSACITLSWPPAPLPPAGQWPADPGTRPAPGAPRHLAVGVHGRVRLVVLGERRN
jgi:hypothetical protein